MKKHIFYVTKFTLFFSGFILFGFLLIVSIVYGAPGDIERVSLDSAGGQGNDGSWHCSISSDGRFVAFGSDATNLTPGDTNGVGDVFVKDRQTNAIERVSLDSAGVQGDNGSWHCSISSDGRFVAFGSDATNLTVDINGVRDVFVKDRQTDAIEIVSLDSAGVQGDNGSDGPSISSDGRFVAFDSGATNLTPGDTNGVSDVFVKDRQTDAIERVSLDSAGVQANHRSWYPSISSDGRFVVFGSFATNLTPGDTNGFSDVFVKDRQTNAIERVSLDSAGVQGDNGSWYSSISSDGRFVAFDSIATNLTPGDTNGFSDVFVKDRQTGAIEIVSLDSAGGQGNNNSFGPSISSDGRFVAFGSIATNLTPGDTNGAWDVFVKDRQTDAIEIVSLDSAGGQGNDGSWHCSISSNGRFVVFGSFATNLTPGDTNGFSDVFVKEIGGVAIPTLNEYGIMFLLLMLGSSALKVLRRSNI